MNQQPSVMEKLQDTARRRLLDRWKGLHTRPSDAQADRELDEIASALTRLEEGSWGRCQSCAGAIGRQRLLAVPEARFCLSCEPAD